MVQNMSVVINVFIVSNYVQLLSLSSDAPLLKEKERESTEIDVDYSSKIHTNLEITTVKLEKGEGGITTQCS
jgi:hypothetical protein